MIWQAMSGSGWTTGIIELIILMALRIIPRAILKVSSNLFAVAHGSISRTL